MSINRCGIDMAVAINSFNILFRNLMHTLCKIMIFISNEMNIGTRCDTPLTPLTYVLIHGNVLIHYSVLRRGI